MPGVDSGAVLNEDEQSMPGQGASMQAMGTRDTSCMALRRAMSTARSPALGPVLVESDPNPASGMRERYAIYGSKTPKPFQALGVIATAKTTELEIRSRTSGVSFHQSNHGFLSETDTANEKHPRYAGV